jgi:hypothetical protein
MEIQESNKTLSINNFDRIIITSVKKPITGKYSFLVLNEKSNHALVTDNISIDGTKLEAN